MKQVFKNTRRDFVKKLMLGSTSLSVLSMGPLGLINTALAASNSSQITDYKALVCVFLYGGNDSNNLIIPISGQQRIDYERLRGNLAINNPLDLNESIEGGLGFNPQMTKLHALFLQGKVAIQANIGTHYGDGFAHNSQQEAWLRGSGLKYSKGNGWGAKMLEKENNNTAPHYLQNISLYGNNTWSSGSLTNALAIGSHHIPNTALYHHDEAALAGKANLEKHFQKMATSDHVLMKEYAKVFINSEEQSSALKASLAEVPPITGFGDSGLSEQLKRVLELIKLQQNSGGSRQIFFVGLSGFDTHRGQEALQRNGIGYHSNLLLTLSESLSEFYTATETLGLQDKITTFTMSEFNRTLTENTGGGSDHGWGGHQIILGGAVKGGIYGSMPSFSDNSLNLLGKGILKPSTQAEQMTGGLARWYGLSTNDVQDIFPVLNTAETMNYFK